MHFTFLLNIYNVVQLQTPLTHTHICRYATDIDVRDKLFLYNFLQSCFAQF